MRFLSPVVVLCTACAGELPPPPVSTSALETPDPAALVLLGTGAMTPLAQLLAAAYAAESPDRPARVEPSVGSGGGIAAARDGAADLGMVSRSLTREEADQLVRVDVAVDAVVLAAALDAPVSGLTRAEVHGLYAGERRGSVQLLLRDAAESANLALERGDPELTRLRERAARERLFPVLDHDDAMARALTGTPRAVGVFSFGAIRSLHLPLKALRFDGREPGVEALAARTWPATRVLSFVHRPERAPRIAGFLRFVRSERARALTLAAGYLPVAEVR